MTPLRNHAGPNRTRTPRRPSAHWMRCPDFAPQDTRSRIRNECQRDEEAESRFHAALLASWSILPRISRVKTCHAPLTGCTSASCPYREALDLQRDIAAKVGSGELPGHRPLPRAPARDHARAARGRERAARARGRRRRDRRDRPRRQVHLPRSRPTRLLPDPRPHPARAGREEVLPRPRGGADPHAEPARHRGDAHRRAHGHLARAAAAQDREHRRSTSPSG